MTKEEVQKQLSDYKDDDELFVMWWDIDSIYINDGQNQIPITKEEWNIIVSKLRDYSFQNVCDIIYDAIEEELENIRKQYNES